MATLAEMPQQSKPSSFETRPPGVFDSASAANLIILLSLALGTIVLYQPILQNGFVNLDDPYYVIENGDVQHGFTWNSVDWAFTNIDNSNWHPFTWLMHMANVELFGLNPMGHHLASALWHTLNVVLLFVFLRRSTGDRMRSMIVAALFAACPLNVEAVAWVAELKTLLSTTFLLLTLLAYLWYVEKRTIGRYATVLALFTVGLLAKAIIMTLPFLMLLADYWPLKRMGGEVAESKGGNFWGLLTEKVPLFVLSAVSTVVTLRAASNGGTLASLQLRPAGLRIENGLWSYLEYLVKLVWPARLAILYPFPEKYLPVWKVALAAVVLVVISAAVWRYQKTKRYLLVGWCWFLGTLAPVSGIAQAGPQAMADRYAYLSFVGLFICAAWLVSDWVEKDRSRLRIGIIVAAAALTSYAVVARIQMAYWKDSYTVFTHALEVTKQNPVVENDLGSALTKMGRDDLALIHFENAVNELPQYSTAHYNLGIILQRQNKSDEALQEYNKALGCAPLREEAAKIYNNRAVMMKQMGRADAALADYNAALKSYPLEVESLVGRASIEFDRKQWEAARQDLSKAFLLSHSPQVCFLLGRVLEGEGELKLAEQVFELTLQISPDAQEAKTHLDAIRSKLQQ